MTWLVVPKKHQGGRTMTFELIDTDGNGAAMRCGLFDDEHQAQAFAAVLAGADPVYRAELKRLDAANPF